LSKSKISPEYGRTACACFANINYEQNEVWMHSLDVNSGYFNSGISYFYASKSVFQFILRPKILKLFQNLNY
jgi:hypothetical protein